MVFSKYFKDCDNQIEKKEDELCEESEYLDYSEAIVEATKQYLSKDYANIDSKYEWKWSTNDEK